MIPFRNKNSSTSQQLIRKLDLSSFILEPRHILGKPGLLHWCKVAPLSSQYTRSMRSCKPPRIQQPNTPGLTPNTASDMQPRLFHQSWICIVQIFHSMCTKRFLRSIWSTLAAAALLVLAAVAGVLAAAAVGA